MRCSISADVCEQREGPKTVSVIYASENEPVERNSSSLSESSLLVGVGEGSGSQSTILHSFFSTRHRIFAQASHRPPLLRISTE
jgi:hypothetical protein